MFARAAAAAPESPVYARNVELAVIRAAALVVYVIAAAGGVVVAVCAGLRLPLALTVGPLAGAWALIGCLLTLAGSPVPAAPRRLISRVGRRRHVAVPIGIIAVGAAAAVIITPMIITTVTSPAGTSIAVPYLTPVIAIVISRGAAMAFWRDWHQTHH